MSSVQHIDFKKAFWQCIFPRLDTDKFFVDSAYKESVLQLVEKGVGGFCVFTGSSETVSRMTQELQIAASTPLIFSADFEHGLPMRLSDGTDFPHAMAFGKSGNTENTKRAAHEIAIEAKAIGIHWNLAPVADINTNMSNPIINIRSYGEDSATVSAHIELFIEGTQENKVLACAKHFPGHGDTITDSHLGLPVLTFDEDRIRDIELKPFEAAIKCGVKSIMMGHLAVTALDPSGLPASLSLPIIKGLLREKLGFRGLVLTDALDMKAITDNYLPDSTCKMALKAGNNILLMPPDPLGLEDFAEEIKSDEQLSAHVYESYKLIINAKRWCGLIPQFAKLNDKRPLFAEHSQFALKVALSAMRIDGQKSLIPLPQDTIIAGMGIVRNDEDIRSASRFFTMLAQATENDCDFGFIDANITDEQIVDFQEQLSDAEVIIFPVFYKSRAYDGNVDISERLADVIKRLSLGKYSIILLLGNPYLDQEIDGNLIIKTYSDSFASLAAAVVKLSGREAAVHI